MTTDTDNRESASTAARLRDTEHELDALLYAVSHDLRAPIRALEGFTGALREDYGDKLDETGRDYLRRLASASRKLDRMAEGLVKISRLNRHALTITHEDASATANDILLGLAEADPTRQVAGRVTPGLELNTDRKLMRTILDAILSNAWKFTRPIREPLIEVSGEHLQGGLLRIRIVDNGVGFDTRLAENRLFVAFQRFHAPDDFPGEGIGLALAHRGVMKLGGTITCSSAVGAGSTITLTLPTNPTVS